MRTTGDALRAVGLACALLPFVASAGLPVRTSGATNGIKVGEGRMHVYFDLETRADSAASLEPPETARPPKAVTTTVRLLRPEIIMHFRPGLEMAVPGASTDLKLGAFFDYVWHTALLSNDAYYPSRPEGALDLDVTFNRGGPVSLRITDSFRRSDEVSVPAIGVGTLNAYNEIRAALPIRPGGGALEITPSGAFTLEFFMPTYDGPNPTCQLPVGAGGTDHGYICQPGYFSYLNGQAALSTRYQFFPKTALLLEGTYDYRNFVYDPRTLSAKLLKVTLGLAGLVSPKVALTVKGGWAHNFPDEAGVGLVNGFVAQAEVSYLPSETASVKLGYARLYEPIAVYDYFTDDRAYIEGKALLGGRLSVTANAAFDYLWYKPQPAMRQDFNFGLLIGPEYMVTPWLVAGAGYKLTVRRSPWLPAIQVLNYTRNEGYVRFTVSY